MTRPLRRWHARLLLLLALLLPLALAWALLSREAALPEAGSRPSAEGAPR